MTLHEKYQTLVSRGMPQHPMLAWSRDWSAFWYREAHDHPMDQADAAAIIEKHAREWVQSMLFSKRSAVLETMLDNLTRLDSGERVHPAHVLLHVNIDAVLAATSNFPSGE